MNALRGLMTAATGHRSIAGIVTMVATAAAACPTDLAPRAASTVLTVQGAGPQVQALSGADLARLPATTLTQRQSVSSTGSGSTERTVTYSGQLLRDLLLHAGMGAPTDRAARLAVVEAIATDGYRAVFSWGELFNSAIGDQVIVITSQDGRTLDAASGPLALRSLSDLRPGPRHVRNLCSLVVRR